MQQFNHLRFEARPELWLNLKSSPLFFRSLFLAREQSRYKTKSHYMARRQIRRVDSTLPPFPLRYPFNRRQTCGRKIDVVESREATPVRDTR